MLTRICIVDQWLHHVSLLLALSAPRTRSLACCKLYHWIAVHSHPSSPHWCSSASIRQRASWSRSSSFDCPLSWPCWLPAASRNCFVRVAAADPASGSSLEQDFLFWFWDSWLGESDWGSDGLCHLRNSADNELWLLVRVKAVFIPLYIKISVRKILKAP